MASDDFEAICDGPLAGALERLEQARSKAVQRYWITIGACALLALIALVFLPNWTLRLFVLFGAGFVGLFFASQPLAKVARALKVPALQAIAQARGLDFAEKDFTADGYEPLHALFSRPNHRTFQDRFAGQDGGAPIAFYEARLVSGSGKSRREVFRGLIFSLGRRAVQGETVVMPDRGLFNFFSPGTALERVRFEDDEDFERRFEVYSTEPGAARGLINPVVREQLKRLRAAHAEVVVRLAGETVTVALSERGDRFEVGSMLKPMPGRERVRGLWDDLEEGLAKARQLRQALG